MKTALLQLDSAHPVICRLIELQGEDSDRTFARDWLSVSETTWFRIRTNDYRTPDHSKALTKLTTDLSKIIEHQAITAGGSASRILPLFHITETRQALNLAFAEERNRLVIVLSDTGGGKTTIARAINRDFPGRSASCEATESWRKSYLAGIHGIGGACHLKGMANNSRAAEDELFKELAARPRIVQIDEGNYFGPACLNLVKAILNKSSSVVVLYALPVFWTYITRTSQHEAKQLRNRTAALLPFDSVRTADVRLALESTIPNFSSLNGSSAKAVDSVRRSANSFGLWNTVFSVAHYIADEADGGPVTLDMVESAVADISKLRK